MKKLPRIVKGYWRCDYCETYDIDGLADTCPNCGKQKSHNIKYYMKTGVVEYVTSEQLNKAGIKESECDGNHKDWVCPYCEQLNNYSDTTCVACGGLKSESTSEYSDFEKKEKQNIKPEYTANNTSKSIDHNKQNIVERQITNTISDYEPSKLDKILSLCAEHKNKIAITTCIIAFIGLVAFLFWPLKETVTVTDFSWERTITVEEERTVKEDGWSVPSGGRIYDQQKEIKEYVQVIDHYETINETKTRQVISHYETVTETKTRQVISHYETTYTYQDNGNGTFTEIPHQNPVYTTETYTETHQEPVYTTETYVEARQEPVYRQDPIYATRYYYEIDKWFDVHNYDSNGSNKEPYWNTNYDLTSNQRDSKRWELYTIHYNDGTIKNTSYDEWMNTNIGDEYVLTRCRLGIVYNKIPITVSE